MEVRMALIARMTKAAVALAGGGGCIRPPVLEPLGVRVRVALFRPLFRSAISRMQLVIYTGKPLLVRERTA